MVGRMREGFEKHACIKVLLWALDARGGAQTSRGEENQINTPGSASRHGRRANETGEGHTNHRV